MNNISEVKDALCFVGELQQQAIEDAALAHLNKQLQEQRLIIAYSFTSAAATMNSLYLPTVFKEEIETEKRKQPILHICLIQKLMMIIELFTLQGKVVEEVNSEMFCEALQTAMQCYLPVA